MSENLKENKEKNLLPAVEAEDDVIIFDENATLTRIYTYQPYSHWRIKEILREHYGAYLQPIGGYKCNRVPGYRQRYDLMDMETKEVLCENVRLDTFRHIFAKENYPLHKEENRQK